MPLVNIGGARSNRLCTDLTESGVSEGWLAQGKDLSTLGGMALGSLWPNCYHHANLKHV